MDWLEIERMGPFKNKERLDLRGSNSIVYAPNGHGKTSVIDLVRWCIQGDVPASELKTLRSNAMVNKEVPSVSKSLAAVRLGLRTHGVGVDRTYEVERRMRIDATGKFWGELKLTERIGESAEATELSKAERKLKELFPPERLNLNLLTGEHLEAFIKDLGSSRIKRHIEALLQLPELKSARDRLERVESHLSTRMEAEARANRARVNAIKAHREAKERQKNASDALDKLRVEKGNCADDLAAAKERREILDGGGDAEKAKAAADALERARREHEAAAGRLQGTVGVPWRNLVLAQVAPVVQGVAEQHKQFQILRDEFQQQQGAAAQLRALLERNDCVCLRPIDNDAKRGIAQAIAAIESARPADPPYGHIGQRTIESWQAFTDLPGYQDQVKSALVAYEDADHDLVVARQEYEQWQDLWLEDADEERAGLIKKIRDLEKRQLSLVQRQNATERELRDASMAVQAAARKVGQTEGDDAAAQMMQTVEAYNALFDEVIREAVPLYRGRLLDTVTHIFRRMYPKNREVRVQLADSYVPYIIEPGDEAKGIPAMSLGQGEQLRLGMALLLGIREVAAEKPFLLLDAPFGVLDVLGVQELLRELGRVDSQVIILCKDQFSPPQMAEIRKLDPVVAEMNWHLHPDNGSFKTQGFTTIQVAELSILEAEA